MWLRIRTSSWDEWYVKTINLQCIGWFSLGLFSFRGSWSSVASSLKLPLSNGLMWMKLLPTSSVKSENTIRSACTCVGGFTKLKVWKFLGSTNRATPSWGWRCPWRLWRKGPSWWWKCWMLWWLCCPVGCSRCIAPILCSLFLLWTLTFSFIFHEYLCLIWITYPLSNTIEESQSVGFSRDLVCILVMINTKLLLFVLLQFHATLSYPSMLCHVFYIVLTWR